MRAVLTADPTDEIRSVEWKSTLDLTGAHGCFHVARAILGLANRAPDVAALEFEGLGYVIVGAAPNELIGIEPIDHARLGDRIRPYVGSSGPIWTPLDVMVDTSRVLVVTVEPPRPGDRIHPLRRGGSTSGKGQSAAPGVVFVRRPAQTAPADADEIDQLQNRLLAAPPETPTIEVQPVRSIRWLDGTTLLADIEEWVDRKAATLESAARSTDRRLHPEKYPEDAGGGPRVSDPSSVGGLSSLAEVSRKLAAASAMSALSKPDERTLDDYLDQLARWRETSLEEGPAVVLGQLLARRQAAISFRTINHSSRNLKDVSLRIRFTQPFVNGVDPDDYGPDGLTAPPRSFGKRIDVFPLSAPMPYIPSLPSGGFTPRNAWTEEGSVIVRVEAGHLYPQDHHDSDDVHLLVVEYPQDGLLQATWEIRSRSLDEVVRGQLAVAIEAEPVDVSELLVDEDPEESIRR